MSSSQEEEEAELDVSPPQPLACGAHQPLDPLPTLSSANLTFLMKRFAAAAELGQTAAAVKFSADGDNEEEEDEEGDDMSGGLTLPGLELFSLGRGRDGGAAATACLLYLAPATPPASDLEEYPGGCFSGSSPASSFSGTSPASSYVSLSPHDDLLSPPLSIGSAGLEMSPHSPSVVVAGGRRTVPPRPFPVNPDNLNLAMAITEKQICSFPDLQNDNEQLNFRNNAEDDDDDDDDNEKMVDNDKDVDEDDMKSLLGVADEESEELEEGDQPMFSSSVTGQQDDDKQDNTRTITGPSSTNNNMQQTIKDEPNSNKDNTTDNSIPGHNNCMKTVNNYSVNYRNSNTGNSGIRKYNSTLFKNVQESNSSRNIPRATTRSSKNVSCSQPISPRPGRGADITPSNSS